MKQLVTVFLFVLIIGCDAQQNTDQNQNEYDMTFSRNGALVKWQDGVPFINPILLHDYYRYHELGWYPMDESQSRATFARALELTLNKGLEVKPNFELSVKTRGTVPVRVELDGIEVPFNRNDYTPAEKRVVDLTLRIEGLQ